MIKKRFQTLIAMGKSGQLGQIWQRARFYLFHFDRFFIMSLQHGKGESSRPPDPFDIRLATPADMQTLEALTGDKEYQLLRTLQNGGVCLIAERDGRVVGMTWAELTPVHFEYRNSFRFPLQPGNAWLFFVYISPRHRGRGLFDQLQKSMSRYLDERGVTKSYCLIYRTNQPSIKASLRFGFTIEQAVTHLRVLGVNLHLIRKTRARKWPWAVRVSLF